MEVHLVTGNFFQGWASVRRWDARWRRATTSGPRAGP